MSSRSHELAPFIIATLEWRRWPRRSPDGVLTNHSLLPSVPQAREDRPKRAIERPQLRSLSPIFEARQLVPQGDVLRDEVSPIFEEGDDDRDEQRDLERHSPHGTLGYAEAGNEELQPRSE